ncbi:MAG: DUF3352 domain-containing protein [Microcystaceae cyanobacterium]
MSSRNRSGCGCLSFLGTAIVLAAVGTGGYLYLRGNFFGQDFTPLKAATVVPESAFASSYVSTNTKDWSKLEKFGTPETQQLLSQRFQSWQQEIDNKHQINLQKDVIPWLGGVTFAFLPSQNNGNDADLLLVVGIKDRIKAAQFAKKLQNQPNYGTEETKYQGITITEVKTPNQQQFASAVIRNHLVIAENATTIRQAIDTFKGQPSYAQKEGVKELLQQKMNLKTPLVQIYVDDYRQMSQQGSPKGLPTPSLQQIKAVESMVVGIGVEKEGLHLQAVANLPPDQPQSLMKPLGQKSLSQFPSETFLLMQGQGIKQGWTEIVAQGQTDPDIGNILEEIRQGFRQANLDADKDVFGWMDGEFSFGLVNLSQGGAANLGLAGMMVLETSDRSTGEQSLQKLEQLTRMMPLIGVKQRKTKGIQLTEWTVPQQGVVVSYGWLNRQNMVLTVGTSYESIKQQSSQGKLAKSPQYKSLIAELPQKPLGTFYLDVEQLTDKINQLPAVPPTNVSPEAQAILETIKGIGMTATLPDATTSQADIMITLKSQP